MLLPTKFLSILKTSNGQFYYPHHKFSLPKSIVSQVQSLSNLKYPKSKVLKVQSTPSPKYLKFKVPQIQSTPNLKNPKS